MSSQLLSTAERVPTKTTPSPISPVYAMALRNTYKETDYNLFLPATPLSKTSTLSSEECKAAGKRQRPTTASAPWKGNRKINEGEMMNTSKTSRRGFLAGKKLEAHGLKEMSRQAPRIFPKCLGRMRMYTDGRLYPQYGDLKSTMFKPIHRIRTPHLQTRKELSLPVGFEPFLLEACVDDIFKKTETTRAPVEPTADITSHVPSTDQATCQTAIISLPDQNQRRAKSQQELEIEEHLSEIEVRRKAMREARRRRIRQQMMSNLMHANRIKCTERKEMTCIERLKETMTSWWRSLRDAIWVKSGLNISGELPR